MLRCLGYLWPWIFKVILCLGNGRPHCHGTKGTGVDMMPWCETFRKWVHWMLHWLEYVWPWPLTLNFQGQIVTREWEAPLSWNERDVSRLDALIWNTKEKSNWTLCWLGYLWPWLLTLNFQGQIVSREWEAWLTWTERAGVDRMPWCETLNKRVNWMLRWLG